MGYTTEFSGRFVANKKFTKKLTNELNELAETRHGGNCDVYPGFPGFWCQWVPSADGCGIEWDGGEKFYAYDKWLQPQACRRGTVRARPVSRRGHG
jgi:hypothetical protein